VTPLKVIAASLAGLLLIPVLVIGAVAGGFGNTTGAVDGDVIAAVLGDPHIRFTPAARADVKSGSIDARILEVLLLLAQDHELAPVGPLITGHTYFVKGTTRVSNHASGRAVDIIGVDGGPVSPTNGAARAVVEEALTLPAPLAPDEVGGPWIVQAGARLSFTNADHQDHIHIGYDHEA
jgi:hypothetical protein